MLFILKCFKTAVSDRPGGIAGLTQCLAEVGCSVKDLAHERSSLQQVHTDPRRCCCFATLLFILKCNSTYT